MSTTHWWWGPFPRLRAVDLYAAVQLRQRVFVVEQDCVYLDADGLDPAAMHLLGRSDDGELMAYLRAFGPGQRRPEAVIGRVVTAPEHRGSGLGTRLMREGLSRAHQEWGPAPVHVSAQAHLEPWYGSLGFVTHGPGYDEDGIPHLQMRRP